MPLSPCCRIGERTPGREVQRVPGDGRIDLVTVVATVEGLQVGG